MKKMKNLMMTAVLFVSCTMMSQDIEITKGDFGFLKGQKEVNVEFNYSDLKLMKENLTNDQYVAERTKELNEKAKGSGDTWAKKWQASRDLSFEPKFLELMSVIFTKEKKDVAFTEGATQAKYTLIVDAVWIYPGYNVVMAKKGAKVSTILRFVETANKSNVLLEIKSEEAPGDIFGGSFSNEDRIAEGFAKTGKTLASILAKKAYK
ncbi:MAG TPA: hypothetical protein VIV55_06445 [Flavobacterium sp.]